MIRLHYVIRTYEARCALIADLRCQLRDTDETTNDGYHQANRLRDRISANALYNKQIEAKYLDLQTATFEQE